LLILIARAVALTILTLAVIALELLNPNLGLLLDLALTGGLFLAFVVAALIARRLPPFHLHGALAPIEGDLLHHSEKIALVPQVNTRLRLRIPQMAKK
jgi:hypothetical protein